MPAAPLHHNTSLLAALTEVEDALTSSVQTDDEFLTEVASHLIVAGGKRVRPLFSVAAAAVERPRIGDASRESVLGGVSVELVHIGSLYHDDVMDEAVIRRTVDSVNARWGNLRAILAGDFLLARASEIAASLGVEVAGLLAATIAKLCEGQVRELQSMFDVGRTEEAYLSSISGKTASLFASACRIGGIVADLDRDAIDAVTEFGQRYGMAFQMVDDVLDLTATEEQLGKPAGNDLVEGVYTLPVLRALELDGGEELRDLLGQPLEPAQIDRVRAIARVNGGIDAALAEARAQVDAAAVALAPFEGSEAAAALVGAAEHLLESVRAIASRHG
ncbi:polyprenyl synthetase family protein [Actinomarinicola tropica]|uniref:polyprenyl synthetase family protein n=1 Tax=Actinomarinicola tropica TaxID=2789776 RepID=UPI001897B892|nr:polyprenyl synthetase family protein [Actinomarinicola tropica]